MAGDGGRVTILGDGQMGLVLAAQLAQQPEPLQIALWGHDLTEVGALHQQRRSPRLPGLDLPESVRVTSDASEALAGASIIVSATSTPWLSVAVGATTSVIRPVPQAMSTCRWTPWGKRRATSRASRRCSRSAW